MAEVGAEGTTTAMPILGEDRPLTPEERRALLFRGNQLILEAALWPRAATERAWRTFVRTIRQEWRSLLVVGIATWAVALVVNMVLVAFVFGREVDSGAPVVAPGNAVAGVGFATAATVVVTAVVGYRLRVGGRRFWAEMRSLPGLVTHARSADRGRAATHLLWAFAGTMLVVVTFTPAMVGVLAVGTVFLLAGPARAVLNGIALAVWRFVGRRLLPNRVAPPPPVAVLVGAFGTALALAAGTVVPDATVRLALAALAAVSAVLVVRRPLQTAAATAALLIVLSPLAALAAGAAEDDEPETGTLTGTVKDVRGGGVAGVEVVASGPDGKKGVTRADGAFELRSLERGTYRVTVQDPKDERVTFLPDYLDVDLGERAEAHFQLKPAAAGPGEETDDLGEGGSSSTTAAPSTTVSPTSTTPKTPRTLSAGSTVVADFVVKAPVRKLKPAPRPTPEQAAQQGSPVELPTTTTAKPGAKPPPVTAPPAPRNTVPLPKQPFQLPAAPIFADCRDVVGRACAPKAGFVEFTLSRRVLKVGQRVTGSVTFDLVYDEEADKKCQARLASGGLERCPVYSWSWAPPSGMTAIAGSPAKETKDTVVVAGKRYPVVECQSGKEVASATCEWIVTAPTGGWVTRTGAVLEGFASGSFLDADFYAVIPADVAVIEGTVRDQFGQPVPGVTVHMDGPQEYTAVTDPNGWYFQIVEPGDYEIYAEVDSGFGFGGDPDIVPEKHKTKLTVPEDGETPTADLEVERDPCAGSLLARLRCLADPGLLALAGIALAPLVPLSMGAQGLSSALADLESPLSDKLDELAQWIESLPHVPDYRDYPPFDPEAENHLEVYDRIKEDWLHFLRESNPGKTWPEILRNHDIEKEVNRLYGRWLLTDYAAKPLRAGEQAYWDVQGFLAGLKEDWELGGFWKRAAALPEAAQDILFGPADPKTGKRGWFGGLLKPLAEDIEKHGPFAVLTAGGKFALATVDAVFGASDLGAWSALDQATQGMTEKQRNQYLYDHADEVPGLYGLQLRWQKAVDQGDNKAIATLALDLAQQVAGDLDARSKNGMTMTAAEKAAHDLRLEEAARRQAYRDRHGHFPENAVDPSDGPTPASTTTTAVAGGSLADETVDVATDATRKTAARNYAEIDPYARPPMSVSEIEVAFRNLPPGERLKLTPEEAAAWGGYEAQMLQEMRANSLQYGTGSAASDKPWVELKRGNEDALRRRQEGYYEGLEHLDYNLKPNHIKSKSLLAEELEYLPRGMDDVQAGEVVSYNPTRIPAEGEVSPEVRQRLLDRRAEWEKLQAGQQASAATGPVIDRFGRQVGGEAQLRPDGRWYTRQQVPDGAGRRPYDPGYQDTWSDWSRTAGDNDTFAMGAGGQLMPGVNSQTALDATYTLPDGTTRRGWDLTEHERLTYAASGGAVPGEGNTPFNWTPASPDFNRAVYDQTLQRAADEGVLLVDADGFFLTRPGTHY